jgi:hypothetical protein
MKIITTEGRIWNSSVIKKTEYNPDDLELYVELTNSNMYLYGEVTQEEYNEFCAAESQGAFFNQKLRGKKPYAKIEIEDGDTSSK